METPTLAVYLFGFNLNRIVYPWKASIRSALSLVGDKGAVYFCECNSQDDTYADCLDTFTPQIENGFLHVSRHPWADNYYRDDEERSQRGYKIQAVVANYLLEQIGDKYDFSLKLDADEVLCEWSFEDFYTDLKFMKGANILLGRPHYTHLCPDDQHEFDFIYRSKAVLSQARSGFRYDLGKGGDACALGGSREYQTRLEVMHYGKMSLGREKEALLKEYSFQQLYKELGFPDPLVVKQVNEKGYIDYDEIFQVAKERGDFRPYTGPHPTFVIDYLEKAHVRSTEFFRQLAATQ